MKKCFPFLIVPLVLLLASTSFAIVELTVFEGTFTRAKGDPFTEHRTFPGVEGKVTIKIFNGGVSHTQKQMVSDATIRVNGGVVFDEMNFNPRTQYLEKEIDLLEGQNDLEVLVEGKPGSKLLSIITQFNEADASTVIGNNGGALSTPGGEATLSVPPGAISSSVIISVSQWTGDTPPEILPGSIYNFEPNGIQFEFPSIINIKYDPDLLPAGFNETDLLLVYESNGNWLGVQDSFVNTNIHEVSGNVNHFTRFALLMPGFPPKGEFLPTDNMDYKRLSHSATLLKDYNVLITGGENRDVALKTSEIYDTKNENFIPAQDMKMPRYLHTSTLLKDGKVLITGGADILGPIYDSAEIYDPDNNSFDLTGDMNFKRIDHTATLLPDGNVLVVGGQDPSGPGYHDSAEIYDHNTNTFPTSKILTMPTKRSHHTATRTGEVVLIAGGQDGVNILDSALLFDISTGGFRPTTGNMKSKRLGHSAVLLNNNKILITGGDNHGYLKSAEIYDPEKETFEFTKHEMINARTSHTSTLLPDHKVLIVGGVNDYGVLKNAEIYDPENDTFYPTDDMDLGRVLHTATGLQNGGVLVVGGVTEGPSYGGPLDTAEIFKSGSSAISFGYPVTGLPGDSNCPSDISEPKQQNGSVRTWYSVVWGGAYNGVWNTRCKGTGGHPGVDIRVDSDTPVLAIAPGTVYRSDDNSASWGGLIVIKHENIQGVGGTFWSIYAHLKRRDVQANDIIPNAGIPIGLSGGDINDPNHGSSTGPHLHFQIDKGDVFIAPYWPASGCSQTFCPIDPLLSQKTYDPISFIENR